MELWLRVLLVGAVALGIPLLVWQAAKAGAARVDSTNPLTWGYGGSSLLTGVGMYFLTKRWKPQRRRLLAGIVTLTPLASAYVVAFIAGVSGTLVTLAAVNAPFLGASLGWQLAGGLRHDD